MIRATILLAILLAQAAPAGPFNRRHDAVPRPITSGRVFGDPLPQEPAFYTVLALPAGYSRSSKCVEVLDAFGSDPTFVALRRATCLQIYSVNNPDFRHRFKPQQTLKSVWDQGKTALLVVDRDGGVVWWLQGGTKDQYAADIQSKGVLSEISSSGGGIFGRPRPRRPKVCTPETCPPNQP